MESLCKMRIAEKIIGIFVKHEADIIQISCGGSLR